MKAPKELHNTLDWAYSSIKKAREFAEKSGLQKAKKRQCRVVGSMNPIPFKSPFDNLGLELVEFNSPKEEDD